MLFQYYFSSVVSDFINTIFILRKFPPDSGRKRRTKKKPEADEVKMDVQETKTSQHDKIYETHPLHVKIIIKIKADQGIK